mgnify:CR=1 FL=1
MNAIFQPRQIIDRRQINAALDAVAQEDSGEEAKRARMLEGIKARLADLGSTPLPASASDYAKLLTDETEKWGKVIRAAGIKAE